MPQCDRKGNCYKQLSLKKRPQNHLKVCSTFYSLTQQAHFQMQVRNQ